MPDRPDFSPEELSALFGIRDSLQDAMKLPRNTRQHLSITLAEREHELTLSALDKLLGD